MTHGYADLVAHQALGSDAVSVAGRGVDLVAAQYAEPRPGLQADLRRGGEPAKALPAEDVEDSRPRRPT